MGLFDFFRRNKKQKYIVDKLADEVVEQVYSLVKNLLLSYQSTLDILFSIPVNNSEEEIPENILFGG